MMKRKWIQSMVAAVTAAALLSALICTAMAMDGVETALLARGYPITVLDALSREAKEALYAQDCVFQQGSIQRYNEQTGETSQTQYEAGKETPVPYGQIQTNHLNLSLVVSKQSNGKVFVIYDYKWLVLPVNRYQDPIAVTWDNSKFVMLDDSFLKIDYFTYVMPGSSTRTETVKSRQNAYAQGGPGAVAWYADLKGHSISYSVVGLRGYATFTLVPMVSHGIMQIHGQYVHAKLPATISIKLGPGSVSFSGGSSDSLGNQISFSW